MGFSESVWSRAREAKAHIVLPESTDPRMQKAAVTALGEGLVRAVSFIGDPGPIEQASKEEGIDISGITIIDHRKASNFQESIDKYYSLREHKGITREQAEEKLEDPLYYAAMMLRRGEFDGMVAGAVNSTADLLRASFTVVGVREGIKTASSCFIMIHPNREWGHEGHMLFADCATVPFPDAHQLAEIAIASAQTGRTLLGLEPRIAMLSYSTKGSACHNLIDKVVQATEIVRSRCPDLIVDGELQVDAAIVESVAAQKCPDSPLKGRANIFIFPDLQAGNIAYKFVQRLGCASAYGPVLQGFKKPVNDLSRGCTAEEIVNVIAITAAQSAV